MTTSDYFALAALDHQSDEDVVDALRQGQVRALDILVQRYGIKVYSLAYKILADAEEAEAMTQEVFAALWQTDAWQLYQATIASFLITLTRSRSLAQVKRRGWGYAIAKQFRSWFHLRSRQSFMTSLPLMMEEWYLHHPEGAAVSEERLRNLSRTERNILGLAYYEAIHPKSLSRRLNIPPKIVQHRSRKALIKLHHTRLEGG